MYRRRCLRWRLPSVLPYLSTGSITKRHTNEMIKTLEMRTESIHQYLEQVLVEEDFDAVNTIQDAGLLAIREIRNCWGR